MAKKTKKTKMKTHKASVKRFKLTKKGKLIHRGQGDGKGQCSFNKKNRRQKKNPQKPRALGAKKEIRNIRLLINK